MAPAWVVEQHGWFLALVGEARGVASRAGSLGLPGSLSLAGTRVAWLLPA
jgi:hypothetical protein